MLLNDLAIERIMKGRMSCFPADDGGGPGWPAGRKEARWVFSTPVRSDNTDDNTVDDTGCPKKTHFQNHHPASSSLGEIRFKTF